MNAETGKQAAGTGAVTGWVRGEIEAGGWVRCIDVRAGRVIVRPVDEPRISDLENARFS